MYFMLKNSSMMFRFPFLQVAGFPMVGPVQYEPLPQAKLLTLRVKFYGGRNSTMVAFRTSHPAVPGSILGVPEFILMLLRFIVSGTALRERERERERERKSGQCKKAK